VVCLGAAVRPAWGGGPTLAWSITVDGANSPEDRAAAIVVDANGDVLAAGELGKQFAVVKRKGSNGAAVWQRQVAGTNSSATSMATSVVVHGGSSVFAAGWVANGAPSADFTVVKLRPSDGTVVWTASLKEGSAWGIALDKVAVGI
jgi:hypothetical protein